MREEAQAIPAQKSESHADASMDTKPAQTAAVKASRHSVGAAVGLSDGTLDGA